MGFFDSKSSNTTETNNLNETVTVGASDGSLAANSGGTINVVSGGAFQFAEKISELAFNSNKSFAEVQAKGAAAQFQGALSAISGATQTNDDRVVTVVKWALGAFVAYKGAQTFGLMKKAN